LSVQAHLRRGKPGTVARNCHRGFSPISRDSRGLNRRPSRGAAP